MRVISISCRVERGIGRRRKRERMRSIVKGGTEDVRSNPATAGLPPWGVLSIFIGQCGSYVQVLLCLCQQLEYEHDN